MKNIERARNWGRNHGARKESMAPTLYGWIIAPLSISWCLSRMSRHVHRACVPSMACRATRRYKSLSIDQVIRKGWRLYARDETISMTCSIFFANTWNFNDLNAILGKAAAICSIGPSNIQSFFLYNTVIGQWLKGSIWVVVIPNALQVSESSECLRNNAVHQN